MRRNPQRRSNLRRGSRARPARGGLALGGAGGRLRPGGAGGRLRPGGAGRLTLGGAGRRLRPGGAGRLTLGRGGRRLRVGGARRSFGLLLVGRAGASAGASRDREFAPGDLELAFGDQAQLVCPSAGAVRFLDPVPNALGDGRVPFMLIGGLLVDARGRFCRVCRPFGGSCDSLGRGQDPIVCSPNPGALAILGLLARL